MKVTLRTSTPMSSRRSTTGDACASPPITSRSLYLRRPRVAHLVNLTPSDVKQRNLELAVAHAKERLPRDASGETFKNCGLFAPYDAFRTLGSDAAFYVRTVQEGALLSAALLIVLLPAILYNNGTSSTPDYALEYAPYVRDGLLTGTKCAHGS